MFFSGKIPEEHIVAWKVSRVASVIGRKKTNFFNEVKLKVLSKISNWQHKFFSSGENEVLIKAMA